MAKLLDDLNQSNKSYCWNTPVLTPSNSLIFTPEHEPNNLKNVEQIEIIEFSKDKLHADKVNQGIFKKVHILVYTHSGMVYLGGPTIYFDWNYTYFR